MSTANVDFQQAKRAVSVKMVLEACGIDLTPFTDKAGRLRGPCPVHGDVNAPGRNRQQFVADRKKTDYDVWHCFGSD